MLNTFTLLLLISLMTACANRAPVQPANDEVAQASSVPPTVQAAALQSRAGTAAVSGATVARHLQERYRDTRQNCNASSAPAFLCSGILMRATQNSPAFHSWNPNPTASGVSFSYLRADSAFSRLAYGYTNGFIFVPILYANNQYKPRVLCSFPVDADSNRRESQGCGQNVGYPTVSRECRAQGIRTAEQWLAHYNANRINARQCGFNVRDELNKEGAIAFYQSLRARNLPGANLGGIQNEVRMALWPQNIGRQLPMEAFFYIGGSASGRAGAQADQRDFFSQTGILVPIIAVTLPSGATPARFQFITADQTR